MNKIRNFFKVESNYQLFIVNIVFAVTGSTALFITGFILEIFFINQNTYGIFFIG